jgi:hypothetical protein
MSQKSNNERKQEKERRKKTEKKISRRVKSVDVQTSACHISWDTKQSRTMLLQYQHFLAFKVSC